MPKKLEASLAGAAVLFAALGDDTRIALLQRLAQEGPASISALAGSFDVTRQGVTKHLNVLANAGIIEGRRARTRVGPEPRQPCRRAPLSRRDRTRLGRRAG